MIVVDATVWRFGEKPIENDRNGNILRIIIVNDASGDPEFGNYDLYIGDPEQVEAARHDPESVWTKFGRIEEYPRGIEHGPGLVTQAVGIYAAFVYPPTSEEEPVTPEPVYDYTENIRGPM